MRRGKMDTGDLGPSPEWQRANANTAAPRLLTDQQAAAYLSVPVATMKRLLTGRIIIEGRVRWDRRALDAWLDRESGLGAPGEKNEHRSEAETALDDWLAHAEHAAWRS